MTRPARRGAPPAQRRSGGSSSPASSGEDAVHGYPAAQGCLASMGLLAGGGRGGAARHRHASPHNFDCCSAAQAERDLGDHVAQTSPTGRRRGRGRSQGISMEEMRCLLTDFHARILAEVREELQRELQGAARAVRGELGGELAAVRDEVRALRWCANGSTCMGGLWQLRGRRRSRGAAEGPAGPAGPAGDARPGGAEEPWATEAAAAAAARESGLRGAAVSWQPLQGAAGVPCSGGGGCPSAAPAAPPAAPSASLAAPAAPAAAAGAATANPAPPAPPVPRKAGLLGPTVRNFERALEGRGAGTPREVRRVPLLEGLEAYASALDAMGGNMGSYLVANTKKLRASKADPGEGGYRAWALSELPVHERNGYKGYVDDSAWMANLWIGRMLEFFVELFAQLSGGAETGSAAEVAYRQTLQNHHSFLQRAAFTQAIKQLPDRRHILARLKGSAELGDAERDISEFVALGRPIASFCLRLNEELDARLQAERRAYVRR
ncbi:unnamed protein product [Prorocentrum cordatum]|uniref:Glycolipid transfer protein domain-containing protein n=1 Tax=Prorocentrum cordatum TaxID=2364126 RepID=A0ABN9S714_9DINO|nr:unnamed protein product [Polarella glacialis]